MVQSESVPLSAEEPASAVGVHANAMLGLLFAVGLVNYVDRVAMSVLQVPIKAELMLSDEQIGLLMGFAFFLPYTMLSIPMLMSMVGYGHGGFFL